MNTDETISLAEAVGRRFDSIFGPEDDTQEIKVPHTPAPPLSPPVRDMKSIVLSVEWEITDTLLKRYEEQIATLEDMYKSDTVLSQFLKILKALGKHVQSRKAMAHPESIKLMSVVFERFESVVADEQMPAETKRHLLKSSVADFQELKQQITEQAEQRRAERRAARQPEPEPEPIAPPQPALSVDAEKTILIQPGSETAPVSAPVSAPETAEAASVETPTPTPAPTTDYSGMSPHEAFALAVDELKNLIRAEFSALRAEIRMWREGQ